MEQNASVAVSAAHSRLRATELVVKVTSSGGMHALLIVPLRLGFSCNWLGSFWRRINNIHGLMFDLHLQKLMRNIPGKENKANVVEVLMNRSIVSVCK